MARTRRRSPINVYTVAIVLFAISAGVYFTFRWPPELLAPAYVAALLLSDLCFTLAERRRRKKAGTGPAPAIIRSPRLVELALAEAHLAGLRAAYKAGRTSGHPEEALWDIEDAETRVAKLRAGTD
jgi:hypothetical protein